MALMKAKRGKFMWFSYSSIKQNAIWPVVIIVIFKICFSYRFHILGPAACTWQFNSLYFQVNEAETPLPRFWSTKDKFNYIGLSLGNLRVQYKGHGKTHKDASSVRAAYPIPTACGIYYFEVKIISKGQFNSYKYTFFVQWTCFKYILGIHPSRGGSEKN